MRWRTGLSSIMSGALRSKEPAILTNAGALTPALPHPGARDLRRAPAFRPCQRKRNGPGRQPVSE